MILRLLTILDLVALPAVEDSTNVLTTSLRLKELVVVKYTDDKGVEWDLEAPSGAGFTRDSYYRRELVMSDKAVESGIYLRALSREETIDVMAALLVDHDLTTGHFNDAIVTADVILKHTPKSTYLMVKRGSAYAGLLRRDIVAHYHTASEMTPDVRACADGLYQENQASFATAEYLGWREQDGGL